MAERLLSASEAYQSAASGYGVPVGVSSSFVCAHCGAFAQHHWGVVNAAQPLIGGNGISASRRVSEEDAFALSQCNSCLRETVFANGTIIFPLESQAPPAAPDMPEEVAKDYDEARSIYALSPRGAAALLRLVIQKLCPLLGSTKTDINSAIGELVSKSIISVQLQQALDSVRVIGNEAVHPGQIDFEDNSGIAQSLFGLVNFIVEKGITEPKRIGEIYAALPGNKLAGIAQRDQSR